MKFVTQEDTTGCAIAVVAMLSGATYLQVKKIAAEYGIFVNDPLLWSETSHVRTLLKHFRLIATKREVPFTSWDVIPSLALLAVKWHRRGNQNQWHWVVYWKGPLGPVVFDPKNSLQSNIRKDFGRMKPKWFIGVRLPH